MATANLIRLSDGTIPTVAQQLFKQVDSHPGNVKNVIHKHNIELNIMKKL